MSRIKIAGTVYDATAISKVTLKDIVTFRRQTAELGLELSFADVEALFELGPEDIEAHPDKYVAMAVMIWATRRAAGEDITLSDAIDVPMDEIVILPDPEDHKPGEAKRAPARTRKASAPADAAVEPAE